MIKLLADNNAEGHVDNLVRVLLGETWIEFWNDLKIDLIKFEDLGIDRNTNDAALWKICQHEQVVLITNNRNADGPDSLEWTIREQNRSDSLPVFTIANPERTGFDRAYAEATALRLLEYLYRLERIRGTGRIYIP